MYSNRSWETIVMLISRILKQEFTLDKRHGHVYHAWALGFLIN